MAKDRRPKPAPGIGPRIGARDARGGEIILRSRIARWIFVLGLVALVVFGVAMGGI